MCTNKKAIEYSAIIEKVENFFLSLSWTLWFWNESLKMYRDFLFFDFRENFSALSLLFI